MTRKVESWARELAGKISDHERRLTGVETKPQLAYSSIEDGSLDENDADGQLVGVIGKQWDGTHTITSLNGPTPPTPSTPVVSQDAVSLIVTWDGAYRNQDSVPDITVPTPMDFARVEVHVSQDPNFTAELASTLADTIETPRGTSVYLALNEGTWYVRLRTRTLSGKLSDPSARSEGTTVLPVTNVDLDALKDVFDQDMVQLETELGQNTTAITAAKGRLDTAETTLNTTFPARFTAVEGAASGAAIAASTAQSAADSAAATASQAIANAGNLAPYGDLESQTGVYYPLNAAEARSGSRAFTALISTASQYSHELPDVSVTAGNWYRVGYWIKATADLVYRVGITMLWVDANGGVVNSSTYYGSNWEPSYRGPLVPGEWKHVTELYQAPAKNGTVPITKMRPRFYVWSSAGDGGKTVRMDDLTVQDVTVAKSAIDAAAAAQTKANQAHTLAGTAEGNAQAAITAAGSALTAAQNLPKVLHGTGAPAGTAPDGSIWWQHKSTLQGAVTAQWNRVAGQWVSTPIDSQAIANLDVGKLTAGSADIPELVSKKIAAFTGQFINADIGNLVVTNGAHFATAVMDTAFADMFSTRRLNSTQVYIGPPGNLIANGMGDVGDNSGWASPLTYDTVEKPAEVKGSFRSTPGSGTIYAGSDQFPVKPSTEYLFEIWMKADKPDSHIYVEIRDQDGALVSNTTPVPNDDGTFKEYGSSSSYVISNEPVLTTWTKYYGIVTTNADTVSGYVARLYFNHPNGTERDAQVWLAGLSLKERLTPSLIVDGIMNGKRIIGAQIETDEAANTGIKMVGSQLVAYNNNGTEALRFDGVNSIITGAVIRTAASGARSQIDSTGIYSWLANGKRSFKSDAAGVSIIGQLTVDGLTGNGSRSLTATLGRVGFNNEMGYNAMPALAFALDGEGSFYRAPQIGSIDGYSLYLDGGRGSFGSDSKLELEMGTTTLTGASEIVLFAGGGPVNAYSTGFHIASEDFSVGGNTLGAFGAKALSFSSGWNNYPGYNPVRTYFNSAGAITLAGMFSTGTTTDNTQMGTVHANHRPSTKVFLPAVGNLGNVYYAGIVTVEPSGAVRYRGPHIGYLTINGSYFK